MRYRHLAIASCALLALAACKKEQTNGAGETSPASSFSSPPAEAQDPSAPPASELSGLKVHDIPAYAQEPARPDMVAINGTDITVRMTNAMKTSTEWVRDFPALYKPMMDCLEHTPEGAAYAADVTAQGMDTLAVKVVALDGIFYDCTIAKSGGTPVSMIETEESSVNGPGFYPRHAGTPYVNNPQCHKMEPVVARPSGMIGWLAFQIPDCDLRKASGLDQKPQ